MNKVLLISYNTQIQEAWCQVLASCYEVVSASTLNKSDNTYHLTIVDAYFIDKGDLQISAIKNYPTKILVIGDNWPEAKQVKALVAGAAGYCEYLASNQVILKAVESILQGDIWVQRHLVPKVIGALVKITQTQTPPVPEPDPQPSPIDLACLSTRERDVVRMILHGLSNKIIAAELFISERTVKAHLTSIFKKLHVPDRLHLAVLLKECEELLDEKQ